MRKYISEISHRSKTQTQRGTLKALTLITTPGHLFLTPAGSFEEVGKLVRNGFAEVVMADGSIETVSTRKIVYSAETADQFEAAEVMSTSGALALKSEPVGWQTFNFEVKEHHTYIAGGVRVHNKSILSYLPDGAQLIEFDIESPTGEQQLIYRSADDGHVIVTGTGFEPGSDTIRIEKFVSYDKTGIKVTAVTNYDAETGEIKDVDILELEDKGAQYGAEIGKTLGSQFGSLIAGDDAFAQIATSTVLGTIGQNFGQFLQSSIKYSILDETDTTIGALGEILSEYTLSNFGNELLLNFHGQVTGHFSSILLGEAAEALGLEGFGAGLFTTAGSSITQQLTANLADLSLWTGGLQPDELFVGFDTINFADAIGGYVGGQLANEVVDIDSIGEGVFAAVGSTAASTWIGGSAIGNTIASMVNAVTSAVGGAVSAVGAFMSALILPGIGAFVGTIGGSYIYETIDRWTGGFLSDLFDKWFGDHPAYYRDQDFSDALNQIVSTDGFEKESTEEIRNVVKGMEEAYKETMHAVFDDVGGDADFDGRSTVTFAYHNDDNPEGWNDFKVRLYRPDDDQRVVIHGMDTVGMTRAAIYQSLQKLKFNDGDLIKIDALEKWQQTAELLGDGIGDSVIYTSIPDRVITGLADYMRASQIANDYRKYLDNKDAIDAVIATDPNSAFSLGWVATLLAAAELDLDKAHSVIGDANDNTFLGGENHDVINGAGGNDILKGYQGDDQLLGGEGDDTFYGDDGADIMDGGLDTDTVYYTRGKTGIHVYLDGEAGTGGEAEGDILRGIENVHATDFDDIVAGNNASNRIFGYEGDDTFVGSAGADYIDGGTGFDTLDFSNASSSVHFYQWEDQGLGKGFGAEAEGDYYVSIERFIGGAHNDFLTSDVSGTELIGGLGDDEYAYDGNGVKIIEEQDGGNDTIITSLTNFSLEQVENIENLSMSTHANAYFVGNSAANILRGNAGDDQLYGGDGDDKLYGGLSGKNLLVGGNGLDELYGGQDEDELDGGADADYLDGSGGDDQLVGGTGDDTLLGGEGNDTLYGNEGDDLLEGGEGSDILVGGAGADHLNGGEGHDYASYASAQSNATISSMAALDDQRSTSLSNAATLPNGVSINMITGVSTGDAAGDTFEGIEGLIGSYYDDMFVSGIEQLTLDGGNGFDTVDYSSSNAAVDVDIKDGTLYGSGSGGHADGDAYRSIERVIGSSYSDILHSANSQSELVGGSGDDTYIVASQHVTVIETANAGIDEVQTTAATFSLEDYQYVERLTYVGAEEHAYLTGNESDNVLTGGARNDTLVGGAGADHLIGGAGFDYASYAGSSEGITVDLVSGGSTGNATGDTYESIEGLIGSYYDDTFVSGLEKLALDGGDRFDTIDYSNSNAAVDVDIKDGTTYGGGSGGHAEGDAFKSVERVIGSSFDDTLRSATSQSELLGGSGDDIYVVASRNVKIIEAANDGIDEVQTTEAVFSLEEYANVENLTYIGTDEHAYLTGNDGDNVLTGGTHTDTLVGGAGADHLNGGDGYDYASYVRATEGLTIDFVTNSSTGDAAGDTFESIEGVIGSNHNDIIISGAEQLLIDGGSGFDTVDYSASNGAVDVEILHSELTGSGLGGTATGDTYKNIERIVGSGFGDTLRSAIAGSVLEGGAGDDVYVLQDSIHVSVVEAADSGIDEIQTTRQNYSLVASENIENLIYIGDRDAMLSGNSADNIITSGDGHDVLKGGVGNDWLNGGAGSDTFVFASGDGHDTITDFAATGSDQDVLSFIDGDFLSVNAVLQAAADDGNGNVVITVGNNTVTLQGVSLSDLGAENIKIKSTNVTGTSGSDILEGHDGPNHIEALAGDDLIFGSGDADHIDGGTGTDTVDYSRSFAAVDVNLGSYNSVGVGVGGDAEGDSLIAIEQVKGTDFNDTLRSAYGGHQLSGGSGDDTYVVAYTSTKIVEEADEGDDEVQTTASTFSLEAAENIERLTYIGSSHSKLTGNAGDNVLTGGSHNDSLTGGAGADVLIGGDGTDTASYANASQAISFNFKTGMFTGDAAGDTFHSIEIIQGTNHGDTFISGLDITSVKGGTGVDTIDYSTSEAGVDVNIASGWNGFGYDGFGSGGDAEGDTFTNVERVIGSDHDDVLTAARNQEMIGGLGDDVYVVTRTVNVSAIEQIGEGDDEIQSTISHISLENFNHIERLTYIGTGSGFLTGSDRDDIITGGSRDDELTGGAGADVLIGGEGTDTASYADASQAISFNFKTGVFTGDAAGDTFQSIEIVQGTNHGDTFVSGLEAISIKGGTGVDTVDYSTSEAGVQVNIASRWNGAGYDGFGSGGDAEGDTYTNVERVIGSAYGDVLTGAQNQEMIGGLGDDIYVVTNTVNLSIFEQFDEGNDEIQSTVSHISLANYNHIERLSYVGTSSGFLTGSDRDDIITGGARGDRLTGGAGADVLIGGEGSDTFVFQNGDLGHDTVIDFEAGVGYGDLLRFETSLFSDLSAVLAAASDDGSDTTIFIDSETSITLQNVLVSQLHEDDFQFV